MPLNYTQTITRQSTGLINVDKSLHELWIPPASPHACDDEFDGISWHAISTIWSRTRFDDLNAMDPYSSFASGGARWSLTWRPGWLMVQPDCSNPWHSNWSTLTQTVSATNLAILVRGAFGFRYNSSAGYGDYRLGLRLQTADWATLVLQMNANFGFAAGAIYTLWEYYDGAWHWVNPTGNVITTGQPFEYWLIQKRNTTYGGWSSSDQAQWVYLGQVGPITGTTDRVTLFFANGTATATPGNPMMGVDFIRFKEDATSWPP